MGDPSRSRGLRGALPALAGGAGLAVLIGGCGAAGGEGVPEPAQAPEEQRAEEHMVAAAHPAAVEAGLEALRAGGHAIDAAVAVQMTLNVVEPPESGIGGGGFLLYRDAASGGLTVFDGRETAPMAATPERFMALGMAMPLWSGVVSGRSVGVPGLVAMLHDAHGEHGRLPWAELVEPAAELAEAGLEMPPRLRRQVADDFTLRLFPATRAAFYRPAGKDEPRLVNPELAATLRTLAAEGPEAFYHGEIGEAVVDAATGRWFRRSDLTREDLAAYEPRRREAVCGGYRGWTLCGPGPPSSGGIAVLQILGKLERFDMEALEPGSAEAIHLIAEATRLAFADRFYYVGDPDFVDVPTEWLVSPGYLAERGELITRAQALTRPRPGEPRVRPYIPEAPEVEEQETAGTTHFSIVDGDGNAVAMTSSIEAPFGSRIMAAGFLLNNQLTDFGFRPVVGGRELPNAVEPGKRPRSSMAPFVAFDDAGELRLVVGSRGGSRIIGYVAKALVAMLDWGMSPQEAASFPNFLARNGRLELERGTPVADHAEVLERLGHAVRVTDLTSGLHIIERTEEGWRGGADPRLDGLARGD